MKYKVLIGICMGAILMNSCDGKSTFSKGEYGYDVAFFAENEIGFVELKSADEKAKVLIVPVWLLCMFNPEPTTTVFMPYRKDHEGVIVNDDYFGEMPADRLRVENGMIYFKIDGNFRSKIGLPAGSAAGWCGSYDYQKKLLTLLRYTDPEGDVSYVNSKWGAQDDPFNGDVINAYNDGVTEEGNLMGPFYEIETSSPGAELKPGETLRHVQNVLHLQTDEALIAEIIKKLFNVDLKMITF